MTKFPSGMRWVREGDERRLYDLFAIAHAEGGYGKFGPPQVREAIRKAIAKEGNAIAIIDGPERIEAVIGFTPMCPWYCDPGDATNWYWTEMLVYTHPLHRKSRHAAKLMQFAKWWGANVNGSTIVTLLPRDDLEGKERFFARHGKRVGSVYLFSEPSAEVSLIDKAA